MHKQNYLVTLPAKKDMLDNRFFQQFNSNIEFTYSCFDRIICRGYIRSMFSVANIVLLLRNLGFTKVSKGVLDLLRDQLKKHISKRAEKFNIPILWWKNCGGGKNGSKSKYVEKNYLKKAKKDGRFGPLCILKSAENVRTVYGRQLKNKKGKFYDRLYMCNMPVSQYYIYFYDINFGLCYLKISGYLPFPCEFYFNGHNYLARSMDKLGIKYKMKDNSFTYIEDLEVFNKLVEDFSGNYVQNTVNIWMNNFFKFDKGSKSTRSNLLQHEWYSTQTEICTNVIFKSAKFATGLFNRILDKHHRIGLPGTLSEIFELKRTRKGSKTIQKTYGVNAVIKHWMQGNSIKMYNKSGYMFRVETTINNAGLPGVKLQKPIRYMRGHYWYGLGCNNRFFSTIADIDANNFADNPEIENLNKSILTEKGQRIASVDLRKEHQAELLSVLLISRYSAGWFRTKDLKPYLSEHYSKTAKIGYELRKLIARDLVKKKQGSNYYIVTELGYQWMWLMISQKTYFVKPILSRVYNRDLQESSTQPDNLEKAYIEINKGLKAVYQEIRLIA